MVHVPSPHHDSTFHANRNRSMGDTPVAVLPCGPRVAPARLPPPGNTTSSRVTTRQSLAGRSPCRPPQAAFGFQRQAPDRRAGRPPPLFRTMENRLETSFHCVGTFFAPFSPSFSPLPPRLAGTARHHPSQSPLPRNGGARRPRRAVQEGACRPTSNSPPHSLLASFFTIAPFGGDSGAIPFSSFY